MIIIDRTLPPTKTCPEPGARSYRCVGPAVTESGTYFASVTIRQRAKGRKQTAEEVYFLDRGDAKGYPPGWATWWFSCQTATPTEARPGLYTVVVDYAGRVVGCDCKGSQCQRQAGPCKHKDVIADLSTAGALASAEVIRREPTPLPAYADDVPF